MTVKNPSKSNHIINIMDGYFSICEKIAYDRYCGYNDPISRVVRTCCSINDNTAALLDLTLYSIDLNDEDTLVIGVSNNRSDLLRGVSPFDTSDIMYDSFFGTPSGRTVYFRYIARENCDNKIQSTLLVFRQVFDFMIKICNNMYLPNKLDISILAAISALSKFDLINSVDDVVSENLDYNSVYAIIGVIEKVISYSKNRLSYFPSTLYDLYDVYHTKDNFNLVENYVYPSFYKEVVKRVYGEDTHSDKNKSLVKDAYDEGYANLSDRIVLRIYWKGIEDLDKKVFLPNAYKKNISVYKNKKAKSVTVVLKFNKFGGADYDRLSRLDDFDIFDHAFDIIMNAIVTIKDQYTYVGPGDKDRFIMILREIGFIRSRIKSILAADDPQSKTDLLNEYMDSFSPLFDHIAYDVRIVGPYESISTNDLVLHGNTNLLNDSHEEHIKNPLFYMDEDDVYDTDDMTLYGDLYDDEEDYEED